MAGEEAEAAAPSGAAAVETDVDSATRAGYMQWGVGRLT
jgi:hypothetical protein